MWYWLLHAFILDLVQWYLRFLKKILDKKNMTFLSFEHIQIPFNEDTHFVPSLVEIGTKYMFLEKEVKKCEK